MSTSRPRVGVTVGKFNPPHLGHLHLVTTGAAAVEHLWVLLADRPDQTIPAEDRRRWLQADSPANVTIVVTPDDLPEANEPWAARALEVLPEPPDLAVTSEEWGPGWAAAMGAAHRSVDPARATHPTSGTALRADLGGRFGDLIPSARADLARRVVCIGAESTGKSTLAEAIAEHLRTVWVPEHGRWYWEGRRHLADQGWATEEFRAIATAQRRLADDLARRSPDGLVVADTDALVTAAWHERYTGGLDPVLEAVAMAEVPDLYLLCGTDIPWVQDGTRESAEHRLAMQDRMRTLATATGAPVVEVTGSPSARLTAALAAIDPLRTFPPLT